MLGHFPHPNPLPSPFTVENEAEIPSPALILFRERIESNLAQMLATVGDPTRLRPHIKTHKLPQIVARQVELGITKCKCATLREAEMAAEAGATDLLVAMPPVGPNIQRLLMLQRRFPQVKFLALVDDSAAARALGDAARALSTQVEVLLDLDVGQGRTGIAPGPHAEGLYRELAHHPGLRAGGLHAYDGQLTQTDVATRANACAEVFQPILTLRETLLAHGLPVPRFIVGGTPTFPFHARLPGAECSPGTTVLWDAGYATKVPDLPYQWAAMLLTRVVSKPGPGRLCVDLGHKAVASEMPHPRAIFPALPDARAITHSEEHLVIETAHADAYPVGATLHAVPWHICPTVALHEAAWIVEGQRVVDRWPIAARGRLLQGEVFPA